MKGDSFEYKRMQMPVVSLVEEGFYLNYFWKELRNDTDNNYHLKLNQLERHMIANNASLLMTRLSARDAAILVFTTII